MSVYWWIEYGVRRSVASAATPVPIAANRSTGAITLRLETPAARMAVISPSAASRPSPIRMPTSTPKGMVKGIQPAQPDQDAHQHAEGNGEGQHGGNRQGEQLEHQTRIRGGAFHQQFENRVHLAQVENERGEQRAQHRAREDLAKNVPAQQPQRKLASTASCPARKPPATSAAPLRPDAIPDRRSRSRGPPRRSLPCSRRRSAQTARNCPGTRRPRYRRRPPGCPSANER